MNPTTPAAPAREPVVVVACGARKTDHPAPAGALYLGSYHRAMRRGAHALTRDGGRVVILSALHGLVELDTVLDPYNLRMGEPGSVTAATLREQAAALGLDRAQVTVLGGKAYVQALQEVVPDALAPLTGTRGIGEQLARLAAIYRDAPAATTVELVGRDAAARAADTAERQERQRARLVTASPLHVDGADRATARLDFPAAKGKGADRAWAAARFAPAYRVQVTAPSRLVLEVDGTAHDAARFLAALPGLLEYAEELASAAARHYGRWERHSAAAPHLAGLDERQRRHAARDFRAEAYRAAVDGLLDMPAADPVLDSARPAWELAREIGATYARYGWVDITERADAEHAGQLLADAERDEEQQAAGALLPTGQAPAPAVPRVRAAELPHTPARPAARRAPAPTACRWAPFRPAPREGRRPLAGRRRGPTTCG
jgi:hypothetical protein